VTGTPKLELGEDYNTVSLFYGYGNNGANDASEAEETFYRYDVSFILPNHLRSNLGLALKLYFINPSTDWMGNPTITFGSIML